GDEPRRQHERHEPDRHQGQAELVPYAQAPPHHTPPTSTSRRPNTAPMSRLLTSPTPSPSPSPRRRSPISTAAPIPTRLCHAPPTRSPSPSAESASVSASFACQPSAP